MVTIGTCVWLVPEFCCERRPDLFYIFDWTTKSWSNEYTSTVTPEEYPGGAVEVSMEFLPDELDCVGIKWPKCIQNGTEPIETIISDLTLDTSDMQLCAKICATSVNCQLWKFSEAVKKCWMYTSDIFSEEANVGPITVNFGSKDCFEKV